MAKRIKDIDVEVEIARLKDVLSYDPLTGIFMWTKTISSHAVKGRRAGTFSNTYVVIQFDRRMYVAHRLAWLFMTGAWPKNFIDHIDGDKHNNRFANLRDVDHSINMQNQSRQHSGNRSGFIGVTFHKATGKWCAQVVTKGVRKRHYGLFDTPEEASAVYLKVKRELHAGFVPAAENLPLQQQVSA